MKNQLVERIVPQFSFTALPRKFSRIFDALMRRAREARDYRHLAEAPDYLLKDVGLTRDAVTQGASRSAWDLVHLSRHTV